MRSPYAHASTLIRSLVGLTAAALLLACGGGAGGPGPVGPGQGLVLEAFLQAGQDNVPLNRVLTFQFNEPVDPNTVEPGSIQIRMGPEFGETAAGTYDVDGAFVHFRPQLPTTPDLRGGGLQPDTAYRVVLLGHPEEDALRNTGGQPLASTITAEFRTLPDTSPDLYEDQIPGVAPSILAYAPQPTLEVRLADAAPAAVAVAAGNELRFRISENVDPRTVTQDAVLFVLARTGEKGVDPQTTPEAFRPAPNGNLTGFDSITDAAPGDDFDWGATNSTLLTPPQNIPVLLRVEQDYRDTWIVVAPRFGIYPDNGLLVAQVGNGVRDFGGLPLAPVTVSFTTENLAGVVGSRRIDFAGDVGIDEDLTSAEVDTDRAPGRAQGFLKIGGDGNNGVDLTSPAGPTPCTGQADAPDGPTDFDTAVLGPNVVLDTGATNHCANTSDGSTAVVFEYENFRIRSGHTVRVIGVNPALILVRKDVLIEGGGQLLARGEAGGDSTAQGSVGPSFPGGRGFAGGGHGGRSLSFQEMESGGPKSLDGFAAYGSLDWDPGMVEGGFGQGGQGAGEGGSSSVPGPCNTDSGAQGGGGGGHATFGGPADDVEPSNSTWDLADAGGGGSEIPSGADNRRLLAPSAGSGGGGGGTESMSGDRSSGAGGGGGGGFVGLTAGGNITIRGTIDVSGGRGGQGGWDPDGSCGNGANSGGGGGGAGGAIRLLSAGSVDVGGAALRAAGGAAGAPGTPAGPKAGAGANGRIAIEDADGVILGVGTASVVPAPGADGYYSARLDSSRFVFGGLEPRVVTQPFLVGSLAPDYEQPTADDFAALLPTDAAGTPGRVVMQVELRGFDIASDGTLEEASATPWTEIGHFENDTTTAPLWVRATGLAMDVLDGHPWLQLRVTFFLVAGLDPATPGPALDAWTIRFLSDS